MFQNNHNVNYFSEQINFASKIEVAMEKSKEVTILHTWQGNEKIEIAVKSLFKCVRA